jgi:hypothetical protein
MQYAAAIPNLSSIEGEAGKQMATEFHYLCIIAGTAAKSAQDLTYCE